MQVGPAADMFSYGLLAWQVLTGRDIDATFGTLSATLNSWDQVYDAVYTQGLLPSLLKVEQLPEKWRGIVAACLGADPRKRFTAKQVLQAMATL